MVSRAAFIATYVIMIAVATIQKPGSFMVQIILFVIYVLLYAKQKHLGCKKSARPIRSHLQWLYKRPKTLISSKAKKLNILLRILSLE